MKIYFIILIAMLLSLSCTERMDDIPETQTPRDTTERIFLALGDSYTIGQSVTEAERWPVILAKELSQENIKIRKPEIIATTGWTTGNLLNAIADYKPARAFDMVSLLIGVNNQYQGRSTQEFQSEFNLLLTKAVALAGGNNERVFVLSIPDWGVSSFAAPTERDAIARSIDGFNAIAREECETEKILFIDITEESRKALNDPTMIARDGLHFSGLMHQKWVSLVIPRIKGTVLRR